MKFDMNIYYDAKDLIMKKVSITNDVFCRLGENDCADLYNNLDTIEDEDIANTVCKFISNASIEELKEYINVDENSIRYDGEETYYCNRRTLAYLVSVEFDVEKLVECLEQNKDLER